MFLIDDEPTFQTDVTVTVGGKSQTLATTFRALPDSDVEGFDMATLAGIKGFLARAVVSFDNLGDAKGNARADSPDVRQRLIGYQHIRVALVRAYFAEIVGARTGN